MTDERFDPGLVAVASSALERIRQGAGSLALALLLSDDGFEVVRAPATTATDGRFASISSSVQALGEAVVAELGAGTGEAVIVQASQGFVLQLRVPGQPYVLAAHFRTGDNLGTALALVRGGAQEIADAIASGRTGVAPVAPAASVPAPAGASAPVAPRYASPLEPGGVPAAETPLPAGPPVVPNAPYLGAPGA